MRKTGPARRLAMLFALCGLTAPAFAQDIQIIRDIGLTDDLPYAVYYPNVLQSVDDGNAQTILTLQPSSPNFFQCDVFAVQGGAGRANGPRRVGRRRSTSRASTRPGRPISPASA